MLLASYKVHYGAINSLQFKLFVIALITILALTFIRRRIIMFYILFEASLVPTLLLILG